MGASRNVKIVSAALVLLLGLGVVWGIKSWMENQPSLLKDFKEDFSSDLNVQMDADVLASKAVELYRSLNLTNTSLSRETNNAIRNYTIAVEQLGLPMNKNALMKAVNMSQTNPTIFDFTTIIVQDAKNATHIYKSADIPRDVWAIVNLVAERPNLADQPKKYEWANRMIQQLFWDICDNQYGPKKRASSGQIWEVILPFYDYMDALPAKMESAGIGVAVPYHDSDLLMAQIPDSTDRAMVLFYLAEIPPKTVYSATNMTVSGFEGMKTFVRDLDVNFQKIMSFYPNGQISTPFMGPRSPRFFYYRWGDDRWHHGLPNTIAEFFGGWDDSKVMHTSDEQPDPKKVTFDWIPSQNGVDQLVGRNWKQWYPLVKLVFGIGRFYHPCANENEMDWEGYLYAFPSLFKAVGIPYVPCGHFVDPNGGHGEEWGIAGLPQSVVNLLEQSYPDVKVGYGKTIGPLLCGNGVTKDINLGTAKGGASITVYQQFRGACPFSPHYMRDDSGKIFLRP